MPTCDVTEGHPSVMSLCQAHATSLVSKPAFTVILWNCSHSPLLRHIYIFDHFKHSHDCGVMEIGESVDEVPMESRQHCSWRASDGWCGKLANQDIAENRKWYLRNSQFSWRDDQYYGPNNFRPENSRWPPWIQREKITCGKSGVNTVPEVSWNVEAPSSPWGEPPPSPGKHSTFTAFDSTLTAFDSI